ncbi:MAG TPA: undecaprenyl-phosphate glucose phosphotransferase, partial [Myxococcaceae bacterium]|nr:undecaprenyl-phosphate glucose phosphotransferase [Myxococcaceae bacterium]
MFNRLQRFWTSIKVGIDVAMLTLAFVLAYLTRFDALSAPRPPVRETLVTLALVLVLFPVAYRQSRLYATNRVRTHLEEVFELFKATITGSLVLVALTYFGRERYSRLTLLFFAGYSFLLVATTRVGFRIWLESLRRKGMNLKSILLVGAGELGERVVETIEHHRELGFLVTG